MYTIVHANISNGGNFGWICCQLWRDDLAYNGELPRQQLSSAAFLMT